MIRKNRSILFGRLSLASLLLGLVILLIQTDWLWRIDRVFYDAHLRYWSQPAPDDIIIIAIDEASLRTFGRWPWQRSKHAQLLNILAEENPKAIAFDIIFAEPDTQNTDSDREFAQAVNKSGNVVLPVLMEQTIQSGQPIETLPFPGLIEHAAELGHVHVELDPDGIARSLYLYEGLGTAFWPHISLAMLKVAGTEHQFPLKTPISEAISPMIWQRNHPLLIPFLGPPNHFKTISYQQVIKKEFQLGSFTDTFILIGTTAAGLGDAVPTPVSGFNHLMSGVELNANILDALRTGKQITLPGNIWKIILGCLIALSPILLFHNRSPRTNAFITVALLFSCLIISTILLVNFNVWFPPTSALLAIILSYPLWSLQRLERTMRYLREELDRLHKQETTLRSPESITLQETINFQCQILPVSGWIVLDSNKNTLSQHEPAELKPSTKLLTNKWSCQNQACWTQLLINNSIYILGLKWDSLEPPNTQQKKILNTIFQQPETENIEGFSANKDVDLRILQVKNAGQRLRQLSRFIDDSIANMADGILVTDLRGQILLVNKIAAKYLHADHDAQLSGLPVMVLLKQLALNQGNTWPDLFHSIIINDKPTQTEATTHNNKDILLKLSALRDETNTLSGIVLNFTNITQLKASERKRNELLNFLSHDLRAPLVSMTALLELAKNSNDQAELESILTRMESNTLRTINLAQQFLQLSRAESSEPVVFTEIDMVTITLNAIEHVWGQKKSANIKIEQHIHVNEVWITGNGELLERALINLLENAIKYSPSGSTVTVNLEKTGSEIHCCINDQGPGIASSELPNIFNRFYRIEKKDTTTNYQGAGLGLALVDTVAKRHRGRVEVKSSLHTGSSFCFILPMQPQ